MNERIKRQLNEERNKKAWTEEKEKKTDMNEGKENRKEVTINFKWRQKRMKIKENFRK